MANEMMIIFIYDICRKLENDDPIGSIIYFHPIWVSQLHKVSLCGQLMGTAYFLDDTFSKARFISLQSGKFALRPHGRFMLAVGSDRNIPDSILEYRANLLSSMIQLFHCDLGTMYNEFAEKDQSTLFNERVHSMMESYLPLLHCSGNILQNMPALRLPKCASNLYLESNQVLQSFLQNKGILGGCILYHNKVLASQLPSSLTKLMVYSDVSHTKTADTITATFHVPNGVQLLRAFITKRDYTQLVESVRSISILFDCSTSKALGSFSLKKKITTKEIGSMHTMHKPDKSILFSNIPEEEPGTESESCSRKPKNVPISRPTFLPLKLKNLNSRIGVLESGINSINFDESDSFPNFIGKTSVCSTPMTENKLLHNRNILSICATNKLKQVENETVELELQEQETAEATSLEDEKQIEKSFATLLQRTYQSLANVNGVANESVREEKLDQLIFPDGYNVYRTVPDPMYPLFDKNKRALSSSLFQQHINSHSETLVEIGKVEEKRNSKTDEQIGKELAEKVKQEANLEALQLQLSKRTGQKSRRDLVLPIGDAFETGGGGATSFNRTEGLIRRRKLSGLELTPLMSKLTTLAFADQESSGFSSWSTTPGGSYNTALSPQEYIPDVKKLQDSVKMANGAIPNATSDDDKALVGVELFICEQQNLTLVLVMQEKNSEKQQLIQTLFEACVSRFSRIGNKLQQAMNISVDGLDKADGYSFIGFDANWDVTKRSGPWNPPELLTAESLHTCFNKSNLLTEVTLKSKESVMYGYQCGLLEVFYTQMANQQCGLPPPQDVMGSIPLCAKRRIERDQYTLLL